MATAVFQPVLSNKEGLRMNRRSRLAESH
ncbi:hypothetical protein D4764_01G0002800 [Takifugu flavidus]|uniref:Uncharacterized protein n=1 Tax=Takifugu flavidus TaxID=433684 RepID=A0A5C6PLX8_9TELE|nr:hypothetical protein D4764_01G0002800 [Takifugu flavidus]